MHFLPQYNNSSIEDKRLHHGWQNEELFSPKLRSAGPSSSDGDGNERKLFLFEPRRVSCIKYDSSIDDASSRDSTFMDPSCEFEEDSPRWQVPSQQGDRCPENPFTAQRSSKNDWDQVPQMGRSVKPSRARDLAGEFRDARETLELSTEIMEDFSGGSMASSISTIFEGHTGRKRLPICESTPINLYKGRDGRRGNLTRGSECHVDLTDSLGQSKQFGHMEELIARSQRGGIKNGIMSAGLYKAPGPIEFPSHRPTIVSDNSLASDQRRFQLSVSASRPAESIEAKLQQRKCILKAANGLGGSQLSSSTDINGDRTSNGCSGGDLNLGFNEDGKSKNFWNLLQQIQQLLETNSNPLLVACLYQLIVNPKGLVASTDPCQTATDRSHASLNQSQAVTSQGQKLINHDQFLRGQIQIPSGRSHNSANHYNMLTNHVRDGNNNCQGLTDCDQISADKLLLLSRTVSELSFSSSSHMDLPTRRNRNVDGSESGQPKSRSRRSPLLPKQTKEPKPMLAEESVMKNVTRRRSHDDDEDDKERMEFERNFCRPSSIWSGCQDERSLPKLSASPLPPTSSSLVPPSSSPLPPPISSSPSPPLTSLFESSVTRVSTVSSRTSNSTRNEEKAAASVKEVLSSSPPWKPDLRDIGEKLRLNRKPLDLLFRSLHESLLGRESDVCADPVRHGDDSIYTLEVTQVNRNLTGDWESNAKEAECIKPLPECTKNEESCNEDDLLSISTYLRPTKETWEAKNGPALKDRQRVDVKICDDHDDFVDSVLCKEQICDRCSSEKQGRNSVDKGIQVSFDVGSEWKSSRSTTPSLQATSDEGYVHGDYFPSETSRLEKPAGRKNLLDSLKKEGCGAFTPEMLSLECPPSPFGSSLSKGADVSLVPKKIDSEGNVVVMTPNHWVIEFGDNKLATSSLRDMMQLKRPDLIESIRERSDRISKIATSDSCPRKSSDQCCASRSKFLGRNPVQNSERKSSFKTSLVLKSSPQKISKDVPTRIPSNGKPLLMINKSKVKTSKSKLPLALNKRIITTEQRGTIVRKVSVGVHRA